MRVSAVRTKYKTILKPIQTSYYLFPSLFLFIIFNNQLILGGESVPQLMQDPLERQSFYFFPF